MFANADSGFVKLQNDEMDYVTFGKGKKVLVMIPGLGESLREGFRDMKLLAVMFALMYRKYVKEYKVYVFGRRCHMPQTYTTRDMARDQAEALRVLGISEADVVGVSQGGMISQYLAIDYPELVNRLVLVVTSSRPNPVLSEVLGYWRELGVQKDYQRIMIENAEMSYTERYLRRYRLMYPFVTKNKKFQGFQRFITQADACLSHNAYEELERITCPTFVIGGDCDRIVSGEASVEIASRIPGSSLHMYPELGHGLYEEAKDFDVRILNWLQAAKKQ